MFKVSNRNTRKRRLQISEKTSEQCQLTTSYLPEVTVQNHILDSLQCQFAIKSLLSVLLSRSMARNLNNSRPILDILWNIRNNYPTIWFMKNSKCQRYLFLIKQPQKWKNFQFFNFKGPPFQYHKVRHLNFCNILHLEMGFWNLN